MNITLNGKPHTLEKPFSVAAFVATLGLAENSVAVEKNREIVPRSRWNDTPIQEGDALEIVRFVGGG